jgi:hypothetical protein
MINLNSCIIENNLYSLESEYQLGETLMKIVSIVNINGTIFFFCEKLNGSLGFKVDSNTFVNSNTVAIHSIVFHKRVKETLLNNN